MQAPPLMQPSMKPTVKAPTSASATTSTPQARKGNKDVAPDLEKAANWFAKAAANGHKEARSMLEAVAKQGNKEAQFKLGCIYAITLRRDTAVNHVANRGHLSLS